MITQEDLKSLTELDQAGRVLSAYLDVDQSKAINLNRGFEHHLDSALRQVGRQLKKEDAGEFEVCAVRLRNFVSKYQPRSKTLVMFVQPKLPLWIREINVAIETDVRWEDKVHLRQLVEIQDEFEDCAVVLADNTHARIFTVALGTVSKYAEIRALMEPLSHLKTAGTDHLYSQPRLQRKADGHVLSYLRRVVEVLVVMGQFTPFTRLLLMGPAETTSELFRLLPKSLRVRVTASCHLAINAPEAQILETTLRFGRKAERSKELEKVEELITIAAKGPLAVTSLLPTVEALNEKRVQELLYAEGFAASGAVCEACNTVFTADGANCGYCGGHLKESDDLVEIAVARALAEGGAIEQVRGTAAEQLKAAGGIGAFLRF